MYINTIIISNKITGKRTKNYKKGIDKTYINKIVTTL